MSDFLNEPPRESSRGGASQAASAVVGAGPAGGWERSVLEKLALSLVEERRRARRWTIFFRLLFIGYVAAMTWLALGAWLPKGSDDAGSTNHTALIDIDGVIKAGDENSADSVNKALRAAFKDKGTAGVVLRINSPGGSPVQSGLIYREIQRLRKEHPKTRLIAVVEEMCASGGYYVAAAADEIYVDRASLVGSIGVLINGFGFVETMHKLGVERRLFTAGENKGFLDPFAPVGDKQRDHVQGLLEGIHRQFINSVREGRGDRLKADDDLFTGLIWTGEQSVALGLADGIGSVSEIARDKFSAETLVDFNRHEPLVQRLARRLGATLGLAVTEGMQDFTSELQWR